MSVSAELAKRFQRLEYFVCIEGVGWPADETDLSIGFVGDVFATADLDGDLASKLGCTVHTGLIPQGTVTESLDTKTAKHTVGGFNFEIVDYDEWWLANFTPAATPTTTTLNIDLDYEDTTVQLADGTSFATGDVVWVAQRECVKLGTKALSAGTVYNYTNSTRGYLGTPRGRAAGMPSGNQGFSWYAGVTVYDTRSLWFDANMDLYAHVPGETDGDCVRIWSGKLRSASTNAMGTKYTFQGVGDFMRDVRRMWHPRDIICEESINMLVQTNSIAERSLIDSGLRAEPPPLEFNQTLQRLVYFGTGQNNSPPDASATQTNVRDKEAQYAIAAAYRYRTEPGGTAGMRTAWNSNSPQALDTSTDTDVVMEFVKIGDKIYLAQKRGTISISTAVDPRQIWLEALSRVGDNGDAIDITNPEQLDAIPNATPARFLLSNWFDSHEFNRYAVNKRVTRHPIDIALCHMMSRDDEYFISDTNAVGAGTAGVPILATSTTANTFDGAALFAVEDSNKGEARIITSHTATAYTLEDAFTNAPTTSKEYQVRNGIYDVLPIGWGMGIPWHRIDVGSFETIRDKYMPDARVGRYILGTEGPFDIWDFLQKNIFEPYGIYVFLDKTTGKLTAEYLGEAMGDGVVDDYIQLNTDDIIGHGDVTSSIRPPVAAVVWEVRATSRQVVRTALKVMPIIFGSTTTVTHKVYEDVPSELGGKTTTHTVYLSEVQAMLPRSDKEQIKIEAGLNTLDDTEFLDYRAQWILRNNFNPPPRMTLKFRNEHMLTIRPNKFLSITWATSPRDPFTGTRGWTAVIARVISTRITFLGLNAGIECEVELLQEIEGGRIAPAAYVTGKGSDGTSHWFAIDADVYTSDAANDKDYYNFAAGDLIELRDKNSTYQSGPYTIRSFGANDVSDPESASTDVIRVDEDLTAVSVTSSDYVTFAPWSASNTANMELHSAYADSSESLPGSDPGRKYG